MLQPILNHQITKAEKDLGVPLDYVRYIAGVSFRSLWRLMKFTRLVQPHGGPYQRAQFVATIVAAQHDDCGSCVQIGVNLALKGGVERDVVRAVLAREPMRLPQDLRDVYEFAEAVLDNTPELDALRERVRGHFGSAGLVEISMAIAMHRVFPALKRGLGYAKSCSLVAVES